MVALAARGSHVLRGWVRILRLSGQRIRLHNPGPLEGEKRGEAHGRIYFFHLDTFGGATIQPEIKLNDKVVGRSVPGGFFFVDEEPGECTVSTSTEVK